jgi:hypothetical protein
MILVTFVLYSFAVVIATPVALALAARAFAAIVRLANDWTYRSPGVLNERSLGAFSISMGRQVRARKPVQPTSQRRDTARHRTSTRPGTAGRRRAGLAVTWDAPEAWSALWTARDRSKLA